ncbi:MAG: hypothetical protein HY791_23015 [Deltaproteobacteria bacterium]|nr:hypothetical protein [Deltaproteobacteria bacterium]
MRTSRVLGLCLASAMLGACSDEPNPPGTDVGPRNDGGPNDQDAGPNPPQDGGNNNNNNNNADGGPNPGMDATTPAACNPIDGSGCPQDRTCVYSPGTMGALCVELEAAPKAFEAACDPGVQDCAAGYSCFSIRQGESKCFKLCDANNGDADCSGLAGADPTYECSVTINNSPWSICTGIPQSVMCSPLNDTCPQDQYCDRIGATATGCITAGTAQLGEACSLNNAMPCARAAVCMGLGADSPTCMKPCDAVANTGCGANESCTGIRIGGERLGFGVCQGFTPCTVQPVPANDTCPQGQACTTFGAAPTTACRPEGTGTQGADCSTDPCARGFVCMSLNVGDPPVSTGFKCWQVCDITMMTPCGAGACTGLDSYDFDICFQ